MINPYEPEIMSSPFPSSSSSSASPLPSSLHQETADESSLSNATDGSINKRQKDIHGSHSESNRNSISSEAMIASDAEEADAEWAKLRCGSLTTEELVRQQQEREARRNRQNRCADYPGLAFGSAMFGSDTTMKFNIIKNELHNIMRSQLKRVDGEVNALASRVKDFDKRLEVSAELIRGATTALAEAVAVQIEEAKSSTQAAESEESSLSAFDQHVLFLEGQLKEARLRATASFQILEDCHRAQAALLQPPAALIHQPAALSSSLSALSTSPCAISSSMEQISSLSSASLSLSALKQSSSTVKSSNVINSCPTEEEQKAENLVNNNSEEAVASAVTNGNHQLLQSQDYLNANNLSAALS